MVSGWEELQVYKEGDTVDQETLSVWATNQMLQLDMTDDDEFAEEEEEEEEEEGADNAPEK